MSHSGADSVDASEAVAFFREVQAIERDLPVPVAHETHRRRVFYNPWTTRMLLEQFTPLKLCCDFSHWVTVAERIDWDDADPSILTLCAARCIHVHARVGYAEGPQVPDPSAPEYANELDPHERWWDTILQAQASAGEETLTMTPEFGPPMYLHTIPHTNVPVANLALIVRWMAARLQQRYGRQKDMIEGESSDTAGVSCGSLEDQ